MSDNKKRIQVTLSKQSLERLDLERTVTGLSKSFLIESALQKFFEQKG